MKVFSLTTGDFCVNTYILPSKGKAIVIDAGDNPNMIQQFLESHDLKCEAVLLTHGHFDHVNGAAFLQKNGAKIYMHRADVPMLNNSDNLAQKNGYDFHSFVPDVLLDGGEKFIVNEINFEAISTPGHTKGGVCYLTEDCLFSGDTLFYRSIGRTDLPTGDSVLLLHSVREKLFTLNKNYIVYPGHERETTLNFEKENNPYV